MREAEFVCRLAELLETEVESLDAGQKAAILSTAAERLRISKNPVGCRIVPFITGRRPVDEAATPWLGSSDSAALLCGDEVEGNRCYLLYHVTGADGDDFAVEATLSFAGPDGKIDSRPIPGWHRRRVAPQSFERDREGKPVLANVPLAASQGRRLVFEVAPERDLLPGTSWQWPDLDDRIRASATDAQDPFTFGNLFSQLLRVELLLTRSGLPVAGDQAWVDVCDLRRFGSLYQRILDRLILPDTARQAEAAGVENPGPAYHPWFPVLVIGTEKAALYCRALREDIVHKKHHLTDPRWLMRVGLYLEFLTCLGLFEAIKDDVGDLLTPAEREALETSPQLAEIRKRLDPAGWREVWALRSIAFSRRGVPRTGPVSAWNLLNKRTATLKFLHVHHQDLKNAIELAGVNEHNAQETWHRVFRDAERAVLRKTPDVFPELAFLPPGAREFVLWHRHGHWKLKVPKAFSALFGDQDGLFASACTQYRASMNDVAAWAKGRLLMDYTGAECVPTQVSLFEAYVERSARLGQLQRRDGYGEQLDAGVAPEDGQRSVEEVEHLLADVPIFGLLGCDELRELAQTARGIALAPMQRIIVQGREGTSMFVLASGTLEVLVRQPDGADVPVATMAKGGIIGEMSLLTGERRSATVRAVEGAFVYEIGKKQYEPFLRAKPQMVQDLALLMEERLLKQRERLAAYHNNQDLASLSNRILDFFFKK